MAKSFNNLSSIYLHPNTIIANGKYKGCRFDSIMEMDPKYCLWMHSNTWWFIHQGDLERIRARIAYADQQANDENDQAYLDDQYGPLLEFEDVPF